MKKVLTYTLKEEDLEDTAGGLVNLILKNRIHVTGHEISRAKYTPDGITCDGRQVRVSERIQPGQTLVLTLQETGDAEKIIPSYKDICVLYEDEDLIALNKEAGIVVHPSPGHYTGTLSNDLAGYFEKSGEPTVPRITGRLDKETSGVIIFAKSRAACARLIRERQKGLAGRTYLALAEGTFPDKEKSGTLRGNMEHEPDVLMLRRMAEEGEGKPAVTSYRVIAETKEAWYDGERRIEGASLLLVKITTGRTHQIRLHMASVGHPLVGDTLYGEKAKENMPDHVMSMADGSRRALLHAAVTALLQPFTGKALVIFAPLPLDFSAMLDKLFPLLDVPSLMEEVKAAGDRGLIQEK